MLFPSTYSWIFSVLAALLFCQLPLLNLLGYESAAFFGVVGGVAALMNVNAAFKRSRLEQPASTSRMISPGLQAIHVAFAQSLLILPPLLALSINAIFVRNCDFLIGLAFWGIIPVVSIFISVSLSFFAHGISSRWGRLLAWLILLTEFAIFLWRLAWEPPIAGTSWLFGWFAGSIYDEALNLPGHVLWARTWTLFIAATFLAFTDFRWRWLKGRTRQYLALSISLFGTVGIGLWAEPLMSMHTHKSVQHALGGHVESAHFLIYYDKRTIHQAAVNRLVEDAEYRFFELKNYFKEDPVEAFGQKITLYVYGSSSQQYALMGSRNTFVARPWTNQAHLRWRGYGDSILAHEMAHLFTAPFAKGPLSMPAKYGLFVDTGLVEGIAVAADWPPDALNPHMASAALRSLKLAPKMHHILSASGFWAQPSRRAYVMTGSFVKWLVDTYGIDRFKRVYANDSWKDVYGKTIKVLSTEWETYIDALDVDERAKALALHRYDRRSIFQKPCARSIGELRRRVNLARKGMFYNQAAMLQRRILTFQPKDHRAILSLASILKEAKQFDAASLVLDSLSDEDLHPGLAAKLNELRGDLFWLNGDENSALSSYSACLSMGVSDSRLRMLNSKAHGLKTAAMPAKGYLLGQNSQAMSLQKAHLWAEQHPNDPLPNYLVGLQLKNIGDFTSALRWLSGPPLTQKVLEEERRRLLAETAHHLGLFSMAEDAWISLLSSESSRLSALADEGLQRIEWRQAHTDWHIP